jgi:hypothetical protein
MPLRNAIAMRHIPYGVCDCVDGTNAPAGAMSGLANLIPDPTTRGVWVPRPAALALVDFAVGGFSSPGFISSQLVVGDVVYGTIASSRNAAKDEPFAYDLNAGAFLTVAGILAGNTPTSPATTGAWTPPILAQVGSRIIVTHPGFPGSATKFGWFDVSGFSLVTTGNTNTSTLINGAPSVLGVQPGMTITGAGITAGTTVVSTTEFNLTTTGLANGTTTLSNLASTVGVAVGQTVSGLGIPSGSTVVGPITASTVVISNVAINTGVQISISFGGGGTITLSQAATATAAGVTLTIAGGTRAAPLWGAGDADRNNLLSVPVGVAQFNARAYFACGLNGIVFSDAGLPCRVSNLNAVQALTTNDGLAVTAIAPLLLTSALTGGIVAALIAFEGATKMQQISGDAAIAAGSVSISNGGLSTLTMNVLPVATGTLAPLSIATCDLGTGFVSPQGLRFIEFSGAVSAPIGEGGVGVVSPFIFSVTPSRICAAANQGVYRITTQNGASAITPQQEFWYDLRRKVWSGPHSSTASLIQPWRASFLMIFIGITAKLYQSDAQPGPSSTFIENNATLSWGYGTSLLPDSGDGNMVAVVEMTLAAELAAGSTASVSMVSDFGAALDTITLTGDGTVTIWGQFNWGAALWGSSGGVFRQRSLNWNVPLVFKQAMLSVAGTSAFNVRIGNLYMKHQRLGYKLEEAA